MIGSPDDRGEPDPCDVQPDIEAKAITTATVIAGVRERIWHQDILMHPRVLAELRALFDQVRDLFGLASPGKGRHRAADDGAIQQEDARERSLKPDPGTATSVAEFMEALWLYKAWSGDPSWRTIAAQADQIVAHSTIYHAMNSGLLPKPEVVKALIIGCGGSQPDVEVFMTARERIASGKTRRRGVRSSS